jgi:hypothetical protein
VFTARYALSPYIKQIRFVFKGLMPFPHPCLGLPSGFFPTCFPTNFICPTFFILPVPDTRPSHLTNLNLMTLTIFGDGKNYKVLHYAVFSSLPLLKFFLHYIPVLRLEFLSPTLTRPTWNTTSCQLLPRHIQYLQAAFSIIHFNVSKNLLQGSSRTSGEEKDLNGI